MSLQWLLVDLNSYFASVEQQLRPELRGRPVGVVPMLADTTCCIAASYEAKAHGVKTGTMVYEAKKMCPGIVFVEARHEEYVEYHQRIVEAVESCLPVSVVLSIDEMACRLRGSDRELENAMRIANEIKRKIRADVGEMLTSSVGIGPNRFLAKIASDMQKPDGLIVIHKEDLPHKLHALKLRDFPGIGRRMQARLEKCAVWTSEQLCALPMAEMRQIWGGIPGEYFWHWLRGHEGNEPGDEPKNRTIGHSHVMPPDLRNEEGAWAVAQKLLAKAAVRLRKGNWWASGLSVGVRYAELDGEYLPGWHTWTHLIECQDTLTLNEALQKLWSRKPPGGKPMQVHITLLNLIPEELHCLSLFQEFERREKLSQAMDTINSKYGRDTVYFAGVHAVKAAAPTRIAFQHIPDLET